jgi:penicillin amidase
VAVLAAWDARADVRGPSRLFFRFLKELRKDAGPQGLPVTWSMLEATIATRDGTRIEGALARALDTVEREDGTDPSRWSWGRVHRLLYPHPFADALPGYLARRLSFGPVALPGEWHTLEVAGFSLRGDRYDVTHIRSARVIVDLARPDDSRFVLPLGQSGQLFDRHAHDQLDAWSSGQDFPLPYTAKAVESATISMLQLVPGE